MQNYNMSNRQDMQPARRPAKIARSLGTQPIDGPDIRENNANIAAMAQQASAMSAGGQPQYLRFSDLGNRQQVNSGMGLQMDGGNLPSSDNQLAFAARQEQRGQRADAQMNSVMNPTYHNGIKVNPAAVAANLSMSAGDKQNLADNGWGVTPGGVIQRQPKKTGSGQAIGYGSLSDTARQLYESRMASGMYDGRGMSKDQILAEIAQDVAKARDRYGMSIDGTDRDIPKGRDQLIASRTDLTDEQKMDFLGRAFARRRAMGRDIPNSVINALGDGPTSGVQNMPRYNPMRGSALSVAEVARGQAGPGQGNAMAGPQDPVRAEAPMPISGTTPDPRGNVILRTDDMRLGGPLRDPLEDDSNLSDQEVIDRRYGEGGAAGAGRLPGDDKVFRDPLTGRAGVMSNAIARPLPPGQESRGRVRYENAAGSAFNIAEFGRQQPTPGQAAAGMSQQGTYGQPQAPGQMAAQMAQQDPLNQTPANMQDGTSLGQYAQGYADQRAGRMGRMNTRNQYWNQVQQNQAMAQQQAMMGQIAQAAMMGNPQAMQMMQTIQSGNRDAAQMAMEQARLMQEGGFRQQEIGILGQRNELMANQQTQAAQLAAEESRRRDEMNASVTGHNQRMEEMAVAARNLAAERDAELDPLRREKLTAEIDSIKRQGEMEKMAFDQQKREMNYTGDQKFDQKVETYAQRMAENGEDYATARMKAKALSSQEELARLSPSNPTAAKILDMPPVPDEMANASSTERVNDFFDRLNQSLNMYPSTYGRGWLSSGTPVDGSSGVPQDKSLLIHAMNKDGIQEDMLREYLANSNETTFDKIGGFFDDKRAVMGKAKDRAAKQNIARMLLGMKPVEFNEQDFIRNKVLQARTF